jgi:poly(3-hydroxyoctanoate) depolymerase
VNPAGPDTSGVGAGTPSAGAPSAGTPSFVRVGPMRVRVRIEGEGPPLLLIMGIGGNLDMWEPLWTRLPGRQVIMFDFPGTGASGASWLPPTMAHAAWFTHRLLRRLGYGRVDVLGFSWGGVLAQHLAFQHPHSVLRLILASTSSGLIGLPPSLGAAAAMVTPWRYYSRPYFNRIAPSVYGGRFRRDPALVAEAARQRLRRPPSPAGYAAQLTALSGYSTLPGLPLITAPTLILAGGDDPVVPTFNTRLMARFLRHATVRIVPGAGHLVLLDSPEIVAPMIEEFLAGD